MLTEGLFHPLLLWSICVPVPLTILAVWGLLTLYRGWNDLRW